MSLYKIDLEDYVGQQGTTSEWRELRTPTNDELFESQANAHSPLAQTTPNGSGSINPNSSLLNVVTARATSSQLNPNGSGSIDMTPDHLNVTVPRATSSGAQKRILNVPAPQKRRLCGICQQWRSSIYKLITHLSNHGICGKDPEEYAKQAETYKD